MPKSKLLRRTISPIGKGKRSLRVGTMVTNLASASSNDCHHGIDDGHDDDYANDACVLPMNPPLVTTTSTNTTTSRSSSSGSSSSSSCLLRWISTTMWVLLGTVAIGFVVGLFLDSYNNTNIVPSFLLHYSSSFSFPDITTTTPTRINLSSIPPGEIAIVQWESRPVTSIESVETRTFWSVAAQWNARYAKRHGHGYYYIEPPTSSAESGEFQCLGPDGKTALQPSWCKIPAMLQVQKDHPQHKYWLYLESDAVISHNFKNQSISQMVEQMQYWLPEWNIQERPIVFNQDGNQPRGSTYYINMIQQRTNYTWALNAGTIFWRTSPEATKVLQTWWRSSMDKYENNPLQSEFRQQWPLDQDRMMAIAHDNHDEYTTTSNNNDAKVSQYIQIASQPDQMYTDYDRGDKHWCLSHTQLSNCFITHYCRAPQEKVEKLMPTYFAYLEQQELQQQIGDGTISSIEIPFAREPLRSSDQEQAPPQFLRKSIIDQ